jgi:DNA ligase (NAD+)
MINNLTGTNQELIQKLKGKNEVNQETMDSIKILLEDASDAYYNSEEEVMSDIEFDTLSKEYIRLGGSLEVGAAPPKGKKTVEVEHSFSELVGTLDKTNYILQKDCIDPTKKSVEEWLKWVFSKLSGNPFSLGISFKFDGNSVVIEYKNGKVVKALTRGRNGLGMDLTHVFKDHTIKSKAHVGIKYEIIIPWDKYRELMDDTGLSYANPRSLVSGKLGDDNAYSFYKYMELVPLWVKPIKGSMTRMDEIEFIEENFGEDNSLFSDYRIVEDVTADSYDHFMDELTDIYNENITARYNLPFMVDGLVIEVIDEWAREELGYATDQPNWATALKFPFMVKETEITGFDFTLGDSGIITARAWYKEVEFNGTIHQKQSLQNYRRFKELKLGIGSKINVEYRNDCLSYLVPVPGGNDGIEPFPYTDNCPVCGGKVEITKTGAFAMCANDECEGKIVGRLQNYLTKMDIKGIKESTLVKLRDSGLVSTISDLYTMDYDKIADIEGLGGIMSIKIAGAMSGKVPYDYEIAGSMGIASFSRSKAKELCKFYSLRELMDKISDPNVDLVSEISDIDGFSTITAAYINDGLAMNSDTIDFLLGRDHKVYRDEYLKYANVEAKKIVFTNFRDDKLQFELEKMGHKITSGVSKKTDIVVCPDPNGTTVKLNKARDLGIPIMTVDDFKQAMGVE